MKKTEVKLLPLEEDDREQFIKDNQWAFKYGSTIEFGMRNDQFEEDNETISRRTIEHCIDHSEAYRIVCDGKKAGGIIVSVEGNRGDLDAPRHSGRARADDHRGCGLHRDSAAARAHSHLPRRPWCQGHVAGVYCGAGYPRGMFPRALPEANGTVGEGEFLSTLTLRTIASRGQLKIKAYNTYKTCE